MLDWYGRVDEWMSGDMEQRKTARKRTDLIHKSNREGATL